MANKKMPENAEMFICDICDFQCYKKSNYMKHLLTLKHKNANNANEKMPENAEPKAACSCGKIFKHMSSLSRHKLKCLTKNTLYIANIEEQIETEMTDIKTLTTIVIDLLGQTSAV